MNKDLTDQCIDDVKAWLRDVVIGFNFCPFAASEFKRETIKYAVTEAATDDGVVRDFLNEVSTLHDCDSVETTILIIPHHLAGFDDYNDFVGVLEQLLEELKLVGVFQLATFHPNYRFEGSESTDESNYTNRAPYPLLHILREDSVTRAIEAFSNAYSIPRRNIKFIESMTAEQRNLLYSRARAS